MDWKMSQNQNQNQSQLKKKNFKKSFCLECSYELMQKYFFSVQSPPYMIKQPPTDEVLFKVKARADENDKPFVIECEAEGEPAPT